MSIIFSKEELCKRAEDVSKLKTVYLQGGFGILMTEEKKNYYTKICGNPFNKKPERISKLNSVSNDTFGFDCVCFVKALLWGFRGDTTQEYGGVKYASNGVPDTTIEIIYNNYCHEQSKDFSSIVKGEFLYNGEGHCGLYIGDGKVAQANVVGANDGVYIEPLDASKWKYHAKLNWIDYGKKEVSTYCPCCGTKLKIMEA